ncbi:MAG: hypothetical protein BGO51_21380 [Rhodospirillales bacterium 69-11]|nr:MAG: hypothetical protein BGO51_21380 [Rhodospirillales bacterium 69-11]
MAPMPASLSTSTSRSARPASAQGGVRGPLRVAHRWIGLVLALPIAVQGLTGAVLALEPWLPAAGPAVSGAAAQPASAIVAAAEHATGPQARAQRYVPAEGGAPAQVQVRRPDGPPRTLLVDPGDLRVVGEASPAWAWLRGLHVQFSVPDWGGRSIGGWCGIALVLLLLSGIPIWWPRPGGWREAASVAWRARGVRFHRSLHGAAGIWTVAILLVLAATGVVLAFPRTSRGLLGLEGGGPPRAMRIAGPAAVTTPDLDRALALARAAAPGAHLRAAFLPATPGEAIRVFLLAEGGEGAASAIAVQVAPDAGRVLAVQDARRQPPADRAYRWMHDLHEGAGLGPLWRAASVIGGLALPLFAVTGPLLWWLRRRNRRRLDHVRAAALQRGA